MELKCISDDWGPPTAQHSAVALHCHLKGSLSFTVHSPPWMFTLDKRHPQPCGTDLDKGSALWDILNLGYKGLYLEWKATNGGHISELFLFNLKQKDSLLIWILKQEDPYFIQIIWAGKEMPLIKIFNPNRTLATSSGSLNKYIEKGTCFGIMSLYTLKIYHSY